MIKIDSREFSRALKEYYQYSSRSLPELVNQSGFNISTTASKITKKSTKGVVRAALQTASNIAPNVPLAAILVNWRRGKKGKKGYRGGKEMRARAEWLTKRAQNSVAYLRSGWLWTVAEFAMAIGKPLRKSTDILLKRSQKKTGGAKPATRGLGKSASASLWNEAFGKEQSTDAGVKHAETGLQQAMSQEIARFRKRIEEKLQRGATKVKGR
jgi:hypothetical protein